jgi:hypothetical protein
MRTDYFSSGQRWFAFGIESQNGVNKIIRFRRTYVPNERKPTDVLTLLIAKADLMSM